MNPVAELEAKDGQQPPSYPNVPTTFTATVKHRDRPLITPAQSVIGSSW